MVVHLENAPMTHAAVVRSWWPRCNTFLTHRRYDGDVLQNTRTQNSQRLEYFLTQAAVIHMLKMDYIDQRYDVIFLT